MFITFSSTLLVSYPLSQFFNILHTATILRKWDWCQLVDEPHTKLLSNWWYVDVNPTTDGKSKLLLDRPLSHPLGWSSLDVITSAASHPWEDFTTHWMTHPSHKFCCHSQSAVVLLDQTPSSLMQTHLVPLTTLPAPPTSSLAINGPTSDQGVSHVHPTQRCALPDFWPNHWWHNYEGGMPPQHLARGQGHVLHAIVTVRDNSHLHWGIKWNDRRGGRWGTRRWFRWLWWWGNEMPNSLLVAKFANLATKSEFGRCKPTWKCNRTLVDSLFLN